MRLAATAVAVIVAALVVTSVAAAGIYAGPRQWFPGQGAGTAFSPNWHENYFATYGSGYDKAVAFIDNQSYSWHNTVRSRAGVTRALAPFLLTVKAHCVAYDYGFWGSCSAY
jgi:hypothetical protein